MNDQEDIQWVQQTLDGRSRAFEAIVKKYHKPLFNVAFRMVSDKDDAEDVVQATFVKAYMKLHSFNVHLKFFSWLYRITINESLNFIKEKRRYTELSDSMASGEKAPDERMDEHQTTETLQIALMRLHFDSRIIIVLRHFLELPYQEIAVILDIPEKTVKSRLFTARQTLKDILLRKGMVAND